MVYKNWQANKASVMSRIKKKEILVEGRWRIWGLILF